MRFLDKRVFIKSFKVLFNFNNFFKYIYFYKLNISKFDQILNLIISFGVVIFTNKNNYKNKWNLNDFQILSSFLFLI